ncbi:MAG: uroporphyrinogen decarboxylase family protein [Desulfobacterales bacterium]|jgi:hypothetical protein
MSIKTMTSRQRFRETMRYGTPDRVPYFEEGIRKEVIKVWRKQGLAKDTELSSLFPVDRRKRIDPDLEPQPKLIRWPQNSGDLGRFQRRLNPADKRRLPRRWKKLTRAWRKRDDALMLLVHRGFFITMGVRGWRRFTEVMTMLTEKPDLVRRMMTIQGDFAARLAENILQDVEIDAAIFSEPIGGNDRPLISPQMYEDIVLKSYQPVIDVLNKRGVETIIFLTFANSRILIPKILRWGFNCLWACEVNVDAMDYRKLREEFGHDLRLIGGIDLDALRQGKEAIRREIEEKVPPLLAGGGYVPLADGRIRTDVPFENYVYYRKLLEEITRK